MLDFQGKAPKAWNTLLSSFFAFIIPILEYEYSKGKLS